MIATPLFANFVSGLLGFSMFIVSVFLILLILVQRGRGGGLTGALGGPGGQSAFGTKAGDLFTRITSFVALGWIMLCAFTMWLLGPDRTTAAVSNDPSVTTAPAETPKSTKDLIDLSGVGADSEAPSTTAPGVELAPANPSMELPATNPPTIVPPTSNTTSSDPVTETAPPSVEESKPAEEAKP